ncbi:hypothetical protein CLI91_04525 [Lentilactobacillus hilgardii]|uniref:Uncharacterized protein n=1 Tax=Lentilactobacillus hilgardii TaxID=1588 RepID=A0A6P1E6A3_LENHI|nr:hypothetical protein [Lentilactobacillus hilgardii]MBZ2203295.1 hypothetical protein [Lentilactobacillus hilgardii]MCT3392015.1 hypothetical protein [Lentilactobacillus hilgardii]QHB51660.1 hypothetical protein GQR93_05225 [Lentilactobacillus hilgardii]RRG12414.1 MAG: hypothetical protein DUD35_02240 [Lactobacillus sp.]
MTSSQKWHTLFFESFQIIRGIKEIMLEDNSNYDLFQRLHPHCFSEAMVAHYAKEELERRADNGDGEAKMLLAIRESELREEDNSIKKRGPIQQFKHSAPTLKVIFRMRLS